MGAENLLLQEIKHIGTQLCLVVCPMPINFPVGSDSRSMMRRAPLADRRVRRPEPSVGADMDGMGDKP
jgi:hypothetical protein